MKIEIDINGVSYPCRPTMGAMLRFKLETGREVDTITGISDMCTYLWCCLCSACAVDKVPFNYSLMEFADNVTQEVMELWTKAIQQENQRQEETGADTEKKS